MIKSSSGKTEISTTSESVNGFRSVFKATSIFGGVQFFNIIISLIRGKVLALLIGTAGMGLNGLLMSSLTLIQKTSGLGLSESAVRDISAANQLKDAQNIRRVFTIFKRWIWLSAIIGVILTISLSSFLSKFAFGDRSYTASFMLLSITFVFGALTGGIYTLLRGMRKIKDLARANISGSITGLLVAIPIFYFHGIDGVVPAIIASAFATYLVSLYFRRKIDVRPLVLSPRETFFGGKQMVLLGVTLTFSSLLGAGIKFILNAYISKAGSLEVLGIYNAGHSIMAGYVGMVFTAMGTDYYPRLAGVINNPKKWKAVVNQQAETVLLILGPILTFILVSAPFLIRILLTAEFLSSIGFIVWASLAIILRGLVWVSSFIFIAKGDNKVFLYTEIAAQIWFLFFNILFFNIYGIMGLGISMVVSYLISVVMLFFVLKIRYKFTLSKAAYKIAGSFFILLAITVMVISLLDYPRAYYFAGATFIISLIISIKGLNRRMDLMQVVRKYLNR